MTLLDAHKDDIMTIVELPSDADIATQLIEQGFALGVEVSVAHYTPFNGPIAVRLHNTKLVIQRHIAAQIKVN